ncbi:flavodoxin domain-containing protein [Aliifodinibius sp. S!AR15-10]|uniref:flavodoxin domain-containing protein n=1 Tax=Aliifodinibius sp. S!AR15-10 TaxID=2950437 RepID=UPI002866587D|nr:flavodoxin domain-containing protein [Aliifodinibius sp. S!AR15-10]MDR8390708.1 flavodoxin domain-containing protein [Aliifodinibius sp. S!AR15-10]
MDDSEMPVEPICVFYGTTTGNSEMLAEETTEKLREMGFPATLSSTEGVTAGVLYQMGTLLLLMSTDNEGDPPMMAEKFYESLADKKVADLDHLSFSVLALGDSYYPDFCQAGKDFDRMLEMMGAHRLTERVDCDVHFWTQFENWFINVRSALLNKRKTLECCTSIV